MVWPLTRNLGKTISIKLLAPGEKSLEPVTIFSKSRSPRRCQSYAQNHFQNRSKRAVKNNTISVMTLFFNYFHNGNLTKLLVLATPRQEQHNHRNACFGAPPPRSAKKKDSFYPRLKHTKGSSWQWGTAKISGFFFQF